MSYEDGMPAGGNSRFRGYSARVSERQQLALIMQMTSQEMTSGSSNRSDSSIPLNNVRSSPLHTKSSKSRWSNKNADLLDVNTSYNRQEDRLRLANGCDLKDRGEFAGSNSPDEVRTASEAESPLAAGSPAECAATATSSSSSGAVATAPVAEKSEDEHQQQPIQEQQQHADPYEMRRTPPQNKVDRQASSQQQQQQQQQQQAGGGGSNSGGSSTSNSARVTLRLNQVRATRDEKKGTNISGTSAVVSATTATGQTNSNSNTSSSNNSSSSSTRQTATPATAVGSTSLNFNQTAMESSATKSSSSGNTNGNGVASSGTPSSGSTVSGSVNSSGNVPNSSSSSSSSADGGDIYEFKSSKEATPVRGSSSSPNPNPDKDGKDSNSGTLASSTANMQNQSVSSATAAGTNATAQGSTVVGSSTGSSSVVSSTNSGVAASSSTNASSSVSTSESGISTSTVDEQVMSTTSPQSVSASSGASSTSIKRPFDSDSGPGDEQDEESRKRKKKETETGKEGGAKGVASRQVTSRANPIVNDKNLKSGKQTGGVINTKGSSQGNSSTNSDRKSPSMNANSPKPSNPPAANSGNNNTKGNTPSAAESDGEDERSKNSDSNSAPKVPPLRIVIPQSTASEQEQGNRNSKNNSNRGHQLPYVVASSNSNDSADKEPVISSVTSGTTSPVDNSGAAPKTDDKKDLAGALDNSASGQWHSHQRVLRSSHRTGNGGNGSAGNSSNASGNGNYSNNSPLPANTADRSNNSSPQQRHHSPTPESGGVSETGKSATADSSIQNSPAPSKDVKVEKGDNKVEIKKEPIETSEVKKEPGCESSNTTSQQSVELHPRKRKIKPNKENQQSASSSSGSNEAPEATNTVPEIHPHDQPITNNYQLFLNIRNQIDKKRKGLFPVQPKPPSGFKDYLMNRCTYVLAGNANKEPTITFPANLPPQMKDLYVQQEHKRHQLRMQHIVEKEKLVLSVEQEILRVHGRAARALANQSVPFSACTFLKDEEVYNTITPEQEEKDRNARSRYNGRLFLSWLQDVDDKWEKIKEGMLLRHHNEAESLHAVQGMDWKWKLKEVGLCEYKATPQIDESHVPMVHVSDDFDLLPA